MSRGIAYVLFVSPDEAVAAYRELDGLIFQASGLSLYLSLSWLHCLWQHQSHQHQLQPKLMPPVPLIQFRNGSDQRDIADLAWLKQVR